MEGESISKCRRQQRDQYQSTWSQRSDAWSQRSDARNPWNQESEKAREEIPEDYENSEEGDAMHEEWKESDEDEDAGHQATSFLVKQEQEGALKSKQYSSWYQMGTRMICTKIEVQDLFMPTPQMAKAMHNKLQPDNHEPEKAWRVELIEAAQTAEADNQAAEVQLQGILEYAIKMRNKDPNSHTPEEKEELAKALQITALKQVPIKDKGKPQLKQLDSGCCGFMMLHDPAFYLRGRANGNKIKIHIAKTGEPDTAESYGAPIASMPTISDPINRQAEGRKVVELSLGICDERYNDLVNENRFTFNLDGSRTPHHVDKENKCIWFYKGLPNQFIVPIEWDCDQMHIDMRPLEGSEATQYLEANPMDTSEWKLGPNQNPLVSTVRDAESIEQIPEESSEEDETQPTKSLRRPRDPHKHQSKKPRVSAKEARRKKRRSRKAKRIIDRELVHQMLCHPGDNQLDRTIETGTMQGLEMVPTREQLLTKGETVPEKRECCEAGKAHKNPTKNSGSPHKTGPKGRGTDWSCDVIGPIRQSINGQTLILVMMCLSTKFVYVRGLQHQKNIETELTTFQSHMERENMKMGTVFTGMTKMCTDSAANLIGKTVQKWPVAPPGASLDTSFFLVV